MAELKHQYEVQVSDAKSQNGGRGGWADGPKSRQHVMAQASARLRVRLPRRKRCSSSNTLKSVNVRDPLTPSRVRVFERWRFCHACCCCCSSRPPRTSYSSTKHRLFSHQLLRQNGKMEFVVNGQAPTTNGSGVERCIRMYERRELKH